MVEKKIFGWDRGAVASGSAHVDHSSGKKSEKRIYVIICFHNSNHSNLIPLRCIWTTSMSGALVKHLKFTFYFFIEKKFNSFHLTPC